MYLTYILQPYFNCLLVPGVLCGFFWIVYIDKHIICEQKWFILFFLMYMPFIILLCLVLASTSTIMLKKRSFQSLLFQKYFLFFSLSFLILVFPLWLFYTIFGYLEVLGFYVYILYSIIIVLVIFFSLFNCRGSSIRESLLVWVQSTHKPMKDILYLCYR